MQYNYSEICQLLLKNHNIQISERSLRRIYSELNLKRKNIIESPAEEIVWAIIEEVHGSGFNLGYRSLWRRLRKKYSLHVKQSTVLKYLHLIDPHGVESRRRCRLSRTRYSVPGSDFLWHLDGWDKLKKYGFSVNGCVDGWSRFVVWLEVSTTNNKPEVIAHYYLNAIKQHDSCLLWYAQTGVLRILLLMYCK